MKDDLDTFTDTELNAIFAVEVEGMERRTEGLFWSKEDKRARILAGSALHDTRRNMGLECSYDLMLEYCNDANAVLPWLDGCACRITRFCGEEGFPEKWKVAVADGSPRGKGSAIHPTFARAAVIALLRARRARK